MAVIGKIRKQSGLLIILVGLAMVLFLLGDIFSSGTSFFTDQDNVIGEIRGEEISQREFEIRVEEVIAQQYGPEGANDQARESIRNRVWQEYLQEKVLMKEYDKLGLSVSAEELMDQVKNTSPSSVLYQYFTNPQTGQLYEQFVSPQTGQLDPQKVLQFISQILNSDNKKDWIPIEKAIKQDRMFQKYSNLVKKGLYATSTEAKADFEGKNAMVDFNYVVKEYNSIPDKEVALTDEDLKAWYNEHKNDSRFKQEEETRSIKYMVYNVEPSPEDMEAIREGLAELIAPFAADTNDTAFVMENTMAINPGIAYFNEQNLPAPIKEQVDSAEVGFVAGPYADGEYMKITKLSAIDYSPDSVKASHILINAQAGDTTALANARQKIDSLKKAVENGADFAELAEEYSEDFGSSQKGGDLDWFGRGRMVPPFENAAFNNEPGDVVVAESQYGVHLIKIVDQTEDKKRYLLSSVEHLLEPGKETYNRAYDEASKFSIENKTEEAFNAAPESDNMQVALNIRQSDRLVGQLGEAREIIRWMYSNEKGTVSTPFELDNKFVVAMITDVRPEGILPFESVKAEIRTEALKDKKAEMIMEQLGSYTSLQEVASKFGGQVQSAPQVFFNSASMPGGLGREMRVLGTAFTLQPGQVSKPIKGNRGVFVIEITNVQAAPTDGDISPSKVELSQNYSSRVDRTLYQALQNDANIEDNRGRFY